MVRTPLISRGDLLRCLVAADTKAPDRVAALCGFVPVQDREATVELALIEPALFDVSARTQAEGGGVSRSDAVPEVTLFRVLTATPADEAREERNSRMPAELQAARPLTDAELRPEIKSARLKPLTPRRRLWPFLRQALGASCEGSSVAVEKVVGQLSRGVPLRDVPRRLRTVWARDAQLLLDWRPELRLFRDDMRELHRLLLRFRGKQGLRLFFMRADGRLLSKEGRGKREGGRYRLPGPDTPVLALSDLGGFGEQPVAKAAWAAVGRSLSFVRVRHAALAPCPSGRIPLEASAQWPLAVWDRGRAGVLRCVPTSDTGGAAALALASERVERLLTLLSPAIDIQPPLLRGARLLLSGTEADVGAEHDAWHSPDTDSSAVDMALHAGAARRYREAFRALPGELKRKFARLLVEQHASSPLVRNEEILTLEALGTDLNGIADVAAAKALEWRAALTAVSGRKRPGAEDSELFTWIGRKGGRIPQECMWYQGLTTQLAVRAVLLSGDKSRSTFPRELGDPSQFDWLWELRDEPFAFELIQTGTRLAVRPFVPPAGRSVAPYPFPPPASPVWHFVTRQRKLDVRLTDDTGSEKVMHVELTEEGIGDLAEDAALVQSIAAGSQALTVGQTARPDWAERFGRDRYGCYADIGLGCGVSMRLRWIPPGTFLMGSPEDENGRRADEKLHRVTLTRGYWLADTPCTQAQWQAVTGQNPSRYGERGSDKPVELIDWHECNDFCRRLGDLLPGLSPRQPSEAEWEYACRAGTASAFNDGTACTEPEGKDPALDRLGWFDENSGGMTHPVGQKLPNVWGLYDMHGNVWEWCADGKMTYIEEAQTDPLGPTDELARRAVRGGGYGDFARWCHSAYRRVYEPSFRFRDLGFRLAAGQPPWPDAREIKASEPAGGSRWLRK